MTEIVTHEQVMKYNNASPYDTMETITTMIEHGCVTFSARRNMYRFDWPAVAKFYNYTHMKNRIVNIFEMIEHWMVQTYDN